MKNFKHYLIAMVALVAGFAISACTPDTPEPGPSAKTSIEVLVGEPTPASVEITVKTSGVKEFAYILDKDVPSTAILAGGTKVEIEDTTVVSENKVLIQGLEANTSHKVYFAFRQSDNKIYGEVKVAEFTTTNYGDVLTIVERKNDGFAVHVQVPEEVKQRGNALRYSTTSLPMYNYSKQMGSMEIDMLLYNAAQYTTTDRTVRYDEYYNYERDDQGNIVPDGAEYADPKVPGEPGIFLIGEFSYMDDPNERICYVDENGDGEFELVSYYDELTYLDRTIWAYPAGWKPGYYEPMYDFLRWINEVDTEAYDSEKYWTGFYKRLQVDTLEPEIMDANVEIKVTDKTPINACISFKADEEVLLYNVLLCTESEYQTQILPLIDNNEDYLRWFVGSYFSLMTFGVHMTTDPVSELWLNEWFVDTKGMAGQEIRVLVSGTLTLYRAIRCRAIPPRQP